MMPSSAMPFSVAQTAAIQARKDPAINISATRARQTVIPALNGRPTVSLIRGRATANSVRIMACPGLTTGSPGRITVHYGRITAHHGRITPHGQIMDHSGPTIVTHGQHNSGRSAMTAPPSFQLIQNQAKGTIF
jgi:hypothetical protein